MDKVSHKQHVLFEFTPLEGRDEIDDKTQRAYHNLKHMIATKSPKEHLEIYTKFVATDVQHNTEELTMGLLTAILAEPEGQQNKFYRDVISFSKDGLNLFSTHLNMIIIERLSKLREHPLKQVFWLTNQLIKANTNTAENICINLTRQAAGGDLSEKNLRLVESILDLLVENRAWLTQSTGFMLPTTIYTFMRLLADHFGPSQAALRQKEVDFIISLIREKFNDCMIIGRDFLRLLNNLQKLPAFEKLSQDVFNNPKSLHPTYQNPLQILSTRTPRRLIQSRLTIDMERKISFLASAVRFGKQKAYQEWFQRQYLSTPESLSLRCDLIRYICSIIHPSNVVLCSDIMPRWAIIGWLIGSCTSPASSSNCKLALFFDWMPFDAKNDNIMNLEPAILVMFYSLRSHANVTSSLLDFLCRTPNIFGPKLSDHIKIGINKSLEKIQEKKVLQSLAPVLDNPKYDPVLKSLVRETFPEFTKPTLGLVDENSTISTKSPVQVNNFNEDENNHPAPVCPVVVVAQPPRPIPAPLSPQPIQQPQSPNPPPQAQVNSCNQTLQSTENMLPHHPLQALLPSDNSNSTVKVIYPFMVVQDLDFRAALSTIGEPARSILEDLSNERCKLSRCNLMDKLISSIFDSSETPTNVAGFIKTLGHCLASLLVDDFSSRIFPSATPHDHQALEESIASPLFTLCRAAFSAQRQLATMKPISLLASVAKHLDAANMLVLYFLRVNAVISSASVACHYLEYCNAAKRKLTRCLLDDLLMTLTYDREMFCFLLPSIFCEMTSCEQFHITGNIELIHLVVSSIDPINLQELICLCLTGTAKAVNKEDCLPLIETSLNWESWEQYCVWKLIGAQSVPVENYISVLPKLDSVAHSEAMSCILLNLQKVTEPTVTMIQHIVNCECKPNDPFISSILRYWSMKTDVKDLAKLITSLVDSRPGSPQVKPKGSPMKTKSASSLNQLSEKILHHLDAIRQRAPKNRLLAQAEILEMISQLETICNESQRKRFADLFSNRPKPTKKMKKMAKEVTP